MAKILKLLKSFESGLAVCWGLISLVLLLGLVAFLSGDWLALKFRDGEGIFEDPQGYAKLCFLYLMAFGSALAVVRNEHLKIDVLEQKLPQKWKSFHGRVLYLISAGVCGLIFKASLAYHQRLSEVGLVGFGDELPMTHSTLSLVVGMGLCSFHFLLKALLHAPETASVSSP